MEAVLTLCRGARARMGGHALSLLLLLLLPALSRHSTSPAVSPLPEMKKVRLPGPASAAGSTSTGLMAVSRGLGAMLMVGPAAALAAANGVAAEAAAESSLRDTALLPSGRLTLHTPLVALLGVKELGSCREGAEAS